MDVSSQLVSIARDFIIYYCNVLYVLMKELIVVSPYKAGAIKQDIPVSTAKITAKIHIVIFSRFGNLVQLISMYIHKINVRTQYIIVAIGNQFMTASPINPSTTNTISMIHIVSLSHFGNLIPKEYRATNIYNNANKINIANTNIANVDMILI